MRTTVTGCVLGMLLLAGCGAGEDGPDASATPTPAATLSGTPSTSATPDAEGVTVQVRLTTDGPQPRGRRVEVKVGEPVTLDVTSEVADEVHVHSDPEVSIDVQPGDSVSRTFTLDRPGQVAVESHATHATIVQLVVRP
ncbi:MAG: hypothetical protein NTV28_05755 [Propionibacteriales bacterium]|nr:hypothetical protein [Propionibacteriales bacterium]